MDTLLKSLSVWVIEEFLEVLVRTIGIQHHILSRMCFFNMFYLRKPKIFFFRFKILHLYSKKVVIQLRVRGLGVK